MALGLLILAIILHFADAIPITKQLYNFSYVCFTAGAARIVFSAFYILLYALGVYQKDQRPWLIDYSGSHQRL